MTTRGKSGYVRGMGEIKNVCLIDGPQLLATAFDKLGCDVLRLAGSGGAVLDLGEALARAREGRGFVPDLVVQIESLGRRCLLAGLDSLACPAMLWCMDPHLNGYWHAPYARLFDLTCSSQRAAIPALAGRGAADVRWLPTFGLSSPSPAHGQRTRDVAFVGRQSAARPGRTWMVRLLERSCAGHVLTVTEGLSFGAMLDLYRDARIVPNESILDEVNFRLFEGASCGCLVLGQDLGEEQASLFEPGREFDTYADGVELVEKLGLYLKNPRLTQAMGQAGRARVLAEHTVRHRAQRILEYGRDATDRRARGREADIWLALTVAAMWEAGMFGGSAREVLARLAGGAGAIDLTVSPEMVCAAMRVQAMAGMTAPLATTVDSLLAAGLWEDSAEANLTGSMAALRLGRFDAAKSFWYRHIRSTGIKNPGPPGSPDDLRILWARNAARRGAVIRSGFAFDPATHLPASASECLLAVLNDRPEDPPIMRLLDTMLRPLPGYSQLRVGLLSSLTLRERDDWRLTLDLALANLRSYRVEPGLEELAVAQRLAKSQGQERAFARALAAADRSGLLAARLAPAG